MNLKDQVIKANDAYRTGTPIISDAEYDVLLSKLEDTMSFIEFEVFKQTLMESSGSFSHDYVIGSLNKVKYGEDELIKWINKHQVKEIIASEKLDGCSFVACYKSGKFVSGASRGDGTTGTDWTEKLKYILPQTLKTPDTLVIRGELILRHGVPETLGFKNARNGVVGIMGEDKIVPHKLQAVTALVYDILNLNLNALNTFRTIEHNFETPLWVSISVNKPTIEEELKDLLAHWKKTSNYIMDGVVISTSDYVNENVYHPERKIAFKVNSEGVHAKVIGIEWNISKGGLCKPVVLIEPTTIDGTTIGRVTGNNAEWIKVNHIGQGAIVSIIRSGEVIPKIIKVVKPSDYTLLQVECPSCRMKLQWKSVELVCNNIHCGDKNVKEVASFLIKNGVENATDKSLTNWGISNFNDLLAFDPDCLTKSQDNFASEVTKNIFSKTKEELFSNMSFDGAGSTNINKLIEFYGNGDLETATRNLYINSVVGIDGYPEGIGQKVIDKIEADWKKNLAVLNNIIKDRRYAPKAKVVSNASGNLNGKSFLLTGAMSEPRNTIEKLIKENGGTIASSVSKTLSILVCAPDSWGNSSKYVKADKLGVKIITEDELRKMI